MNKIVILDESGRPLYKDGLKYNFEGKGQEVNAFDPECKLRPVYISHDVITQKLARRTTIVFHPQFGG